MMTNQDAANITFMGLTVWREARGEPTAARLAVACCIMQRVKRPSWWGNDVQSVLFKRWQFSSLTNPNDPQLAAWPVNSEDPVWKDCLGQAAAAYAGAVSPAPGADSYYDESIAPPDWATPDKFVVKIGRLIFYDLNKDAEDVPRWEQPQHQSSQAT